MSVLITRGLYFGGDMIMVCDRQCDKAWGEIRPRVYVQDPEQKVYGYDENNEDWEMYPDNEVLDIDNWAYLADSELGIAPDSNGVWEGGDGKPEAPVTKHNKWCARNCERCEMIFLKDLPTGESAEGNDLSKRFYNKAPHTRD